jgi:hypothetical protein
VVTAEKHDQRSDGTTNHTNLMDAPRTASHFMGHQKVTTVVSNEEKGAAQQFAKEVTVGLPVYRTIGEGTESIWTTSSDLAATGTKNHF